MTLEDFFAAKAPSNYVESASAMPLMEDAYRKPTPKPEAKGVQTAPVSPKVEEIKKIFTSAPAMAPAEVPQEETPQAPVEQQAPSSLTMPSSNFELPPQVQPQQQIDTTMIPTSELVDMKKIREQAKGMVEEPSWGEFLTALAPLAIEAIAGGGTTNVAPGISANYLKGRLDKTEARRMSMEDKLMEIQKARLLRKRGAGMQPKSLRDKATGESFIGSYDPNTDTMYIKGTPVDTTKYELAPGLSTQEFGRRQEMTQANTIQTADVLGKGARINPENGLLSIVRNGKLVPLQVSTSALDPQQVKDLDSVVRPFLTTDAYKKTASVLKFSKNIDSLLSDAMSGNAIAAQMARSELAKLAEGGGRLSDQDIERLGGSTSYKNQLKRFANLQRTGDPLLPQDIEFMKRVAVILEKNAKTELRQSVSALEQAAIQKGVPAGATQTAIQPMIPGLFESTSAKPKESGMVKVEKLDAKGNPTGVFGMIPKANLQKALNSKKFKAVP